MLDFGVEELADVGGKGVSIREEELVAIVGEEEFVTNVMGGAYL